ncbi:MAG: MupA/Atu3671 family FMN-dependent luciferase-like monooxygenase [Acidobacteriota bacterium]|nr:MupA/Atu3671 family FMN-dependent luciferase-like monooxygenase [Acidobacteriota bacterium]
MSGRSNHEAPPVPVPEIEDAVAVVGLACRFPGAGDPQELWQLLREGREGILPLSPEELRSAGVDPASLDANHVAVASAVEGIDRFDAPFFGFSPREAEITDPQQRVFLECAWQALEDSGYDPRSYGGSIGVFAGTNLSSYLFELFAHPRAMEAMGRYRTLLGNDKDHLPTMVSYRLDLRGPSLNVQTACSTSLVAVHLACQSLLDGECSMALAGGAALAARQKTGYQYQRGGIYSPDGHCRPFDADAQGTVPGNGVGVVVLKPLAAALEDGDAIRAVILGSAINNDGAGKVGYTAPSVEGQVRVIAEALAVAGIDAETVEYVEGHGTGTELGDPIEVAALRQALEAAGAAEGRCALGSIKSNLGHLDAAAGVAGLIKTVLALEHGELVPSLHFRRPNPKLDLGERLYVNVETTPWPRRDEAPRRAGVSSFGIGGTNAHAVLQEPPVQEPSGAGRELQLLVLSARTESALEAVTDRLSQRLTEELERPSSFAPEEGRRRLADIAFTLAVGRTAFAHRRTLVAADLGEAREILQQRDAGSEARGLRSRHQEAGHRPVAFLFPGQGSQFPAMAAQLYAAEEVFRRHLDRCLEILGEELGGKLRSLLLEAPAGDEEAAAALERTELTQPALFCVEYALAQLWQEWGVVPEALLGHSVGEYVAACLAGVFSLENALVLVAARGRLMASAEAGSMLSVPLEEDDLARRLEGFPGVELAVVNGPRRCVAAGPADAVAALAEALAGDGVKARPLRTSHAFHTAMMEPAVEPFRRQLEGLELQPPRIPFLSNLSGTWIRPEEAVDPEYWVAQLRRPVRFGAGLEELLQEPRRILLEVGPGATLSTLARPRRIHPDQQVVLSSMPHPRQDTPHLRHLLDALGQLWAAGAPVAWTGVYQGQRRHRLPLPTYPFERRRHWVEGPTPAAHLETVMPDEATTDQAAPARRERILPVLLELVQELTGLEPQQVDLQANFLEVGLDSLMLIRATEDIEKSFGVTMSVVQLFEEVNTLELLVSYLDEEMPADALPSPAPAAPAPQAAAAAPAAASPPAVAGPAAPAQPAPAPAAAAPPMATPVQQPPTAPAPSLPAPAASGSGVEALVQQQLWLMQQQLEMLRGGTASASPAPASPAAAVPPVSASPALPTPPTPQAPPVSVASPQSTKNPPPSPPRASTAGSSAEDDEPKAYGPYQPIVLGSTDGLTDRQASYLRGFMQDYSRRTAESKRRTQEHRATLADSRGTIGFRRLWKEIVYPILGDRAKGSKIWDVDGNEYVDVSLGFGLHYFGHSPDFIVDALRAQLDKNIALGPQSDLAGEVSQLVCELTGLDRAMFCNSGTESVMGAMRAARVYRRRDKIVIFNGCYHGWADGTLVRSIERDGQLISAPVASGVAPGAVQDVMVLEYDDPASLEIIRRHADELAAVMVEPVPSRRPDLQPAKFLRELRRITEETGVLLIFDEMVTGFRVAQGGAQEWFGVQADLATYGKLVAGGLPIGVIAGKAPVMDVFDGGPWSFGDDSYPRSQKILFSGAFFKHPLTMAALKATMERMKEQGPELQTRLNQRVEALTGRLDAYFQEHRVPVHTVRYGPLFRFVFDPQLQFTEIFTQHLVHNGIFYTAETGNCFLSTAHTAEDEEKILQGVRRTVEGMREGGLWPEDPEDPDGSGGGSGGRKASTSTRSSAESTVTASPAAPAMASSASTSVSSSASSSAGAGSGVGSGAKAMDFGLYYFGYYPPEYDADKYDLILRSARFADAHGFSALLLPERHFDAVGGFSPNPSVVGAALARETQHIQIRAGSVVLPLHHPVRVAEEWAVLDNLAAGRVGVSVASGWHHNDFVFNPDAYDQRHQLMMDGIETVRALWRGEAVRVRGGGGELDVRLHPLPSRPDIPLWLTATSEDTFRRAASIGVGVLTNLLGQPLPELRQRIAVYRQALAEHGFDPASGTVTVLLHTLVGDDADTARDAAFEAFRNYLSSSFNLVRRHARSEGRKVELEGLSERGVASYLDATTRRLMHTSTLIGSPESCRPLVEELMEAGVDEIACFVDFGVGGEVALAGMEPLNRLRQYYSGDKSGAGSEPGGAVKVSVPAQPEAPMQAPMASGQRGLWVLAQMGEDASRAYNESVAFHLHGPFQLRAMGRALQRVVDRHESLRSTFDADGRHQRIAPSLTIELPLMDLSALPEEQRQQRLRRFLEEQALETFDLEAGPLVRAQVARLSADYHVMVFTTHHIVIDGHSFGVVLRELGAAYSAFFAGGEPNLPQPQPFRDFLQKVEEQGGEAAREKAQAYWLEQFADGVPSLELPTDHPRPPVQTFHGDRLRYPLDAELYAAVKAAGIATGSTLYMVLLTAFKVLLHRLTGQRDLVLGVDAVDKLSIDAKALVGFAVNPLPLRSRLSGNPTFRELLGVTKRQVMEGYQHQRYSFGDLVQQLGLLHQDRSRPVLYAASFNMDNVGSTPLEGLDVEVINNPPRAARFEFGFNVLDSGRDILVECELNTDLFHRTTALRWLDGYRALLEALARDPEQRIFDLPLVPAVARHQQLVEWNDTHRAWDLDQRTFLDLFAEAAERRSRALAAVCGEERWTYSRLERESRAVAQALAARGVGPGTVVALLGERGLGLLNAILGVLRAGGAYLPLDPHHPPARLARILERSGAAVAVAVAELEPVLGQALEEFSQEAGTAPPERTTVEALTREGAEEHPLRAPVPSDLAYVIFTSGSTGVPKGVMVEHRGMLNHLLAKVEDLALSEDDTVAQTASQCFDISVWQFLAPLAVGGRVEIFPDEVAHDAERLLAALQERRVNIFETVPSLLRVLLQQAVAQDATLPKLRWLLSTGEALSDELCREWLERFPAIPMVNAYGPTECSDDVTHAVLRAGASASASTPTPTLGRVIANTGLYLLDAHQRPLPAGVVGELCAGGEGVGRGYLDDPRRTATAFVPDPFYPRAGARMYRTGDLVRALPDGRFEFLGRRDHQVKVRGHRIELGEVESVLLGHPAVAEAVVVVRDLGAGGDQLVAYAVPRPGRAPSSDELRDFIRGRLPGYMVPAAMMLLPAMPLNTSGKIDRKALPEPEDLVAEAGPTGGAAQDSETELVAGVWAEVLGREAVGAGGDFFELGGHSLLATQAVSRLRALFGIEISLRQLFETPTPAAMARRVREQRSEGSGLVPPPLEPVSRDGELPLSFAQQRLWFFEQLEEDSTAYSLPEALRLEGPLDVAALAASLRQLQQRHEVLRTTFPEEDGKPRQHIAPEPLMDLPVVSLEALPESVWEIHLRQLAEREAIRPFDLEAGPLMRAILVRLDDQRHAILFTMHHIISDGWSVAVLVREVGELYAARVAQRRPRLRPLPVQYADFAVWQRSWLQGEALERQLSYWRRQLAGAPTLLELPTDRPRPEVQRFAGATRSFELSEDLSRGFRQLARESEVTHFMALLAAYQVLLHLASGQPDVLVGTPVAGRTAVETEGLIGFFANLLVLRGRFGEELSFRRVLEQTRQLTLGAASHQDLPFDKLVEELGVERSLAHNTLFQATFTFDNVPREAVTFEGLTFVPVEAEVQRSPYDLNLIVGRVEPTIAGAFQYKTDLFDGATVEGWIDRFRELVEKVVAEPEVRLAELRRWYRQSTERGQRGQRKERKADLRSKLLKSLRSA